MSPCRFCGPGLAPDLAPGASCRAVCAAADTDGVSLAAFDVHQRALLAAGLDGVVVRGDRAVARDQVGPDLGDPATELLARLEQGRWSPPDLAPADRGPLRALARRGLVVEAETVWFAASAVAGAVLILVGAGKRRLARSRSARVPNWVRSLNG